MPLNPLVRLAMEPPLRQIVRTVLKLLPASVETRARWDLSRRPAYLLGVLTAALQARCQRLPEISVIEFGVAGGAGLLALQDEARAVEEETGIGIKVYGFDRGGGLPELIGDYRDHPNRWRAGDFPMDEAALRTQLTDRTTLVLGDVADTISGLFRELRAPTVGFIAIDLDLYSSTRDALRLFTAPGRRMLWHVPMYLDDIDSICTHRFAGELLAIDEFNAHSSAVKIDRWYGVKYHRPFPERAFLEKLYVAHDLRALSKAVVERTTASLPLLA